MIKIAEIVDYNYSPERDGGKFLNMKQKGDKIVIRLAGKPISYFIHWIDKKPVICPKKADCELCQKVWPASQIDEAMREKRKQQFAWPVIDRADGQAKIFKAGFAIFSGIGEYAKNPKWGDAMLYDLEITRTELSPANFYSVVADPTSIGVKLTKEELEEVKKLEPLLDFTTTQDRKDEEVISAEDERRLIKFSQVRIIGGGDRRDGLDTKPPL